MTRRRHKRALSSDQVRPLCLLLPYAHTHTHTHTHAVCLCVSVCFCLAHTRHPLQQGVSSLQHDLVAIGVQECAYKLGGGAGAGGGQAAEEGEEEDDDDGVILTLAEREGGGIMSDEVRGRRSDAACATVHASSGACGDRSRPPALGSLQYCAQQREDASKQT